MMLAVLLICAPKTLTVIGTTDLHGRMNTLPLLSSYVTAQRAERTVLLLDAGDAFQGTLESDLEEGATIVQAYNAIGYDAMAIGNHEFDYGPVGPRVTPAGNEDPRGALKALIKAAKFPFLAANLRENGAPLKWPNVSTSVLLVRDGLKVGVVGATTEDTLKTTTSQNLKALSMTKIVGSVADEAAALRKKGASIVLLTIHAGGKCKDLKDPKDLSSCESDSEIFAVARALPKGAVDGIFAGHAHQGIAHYVADIPIVESFAQGKAVSRVDFSLDDKGRVTSSQIFQPQSLAEQKPDTKIASIIEPALARADAKKSEPLGPTLASGLLRSYDAESALGNFIATMMWEEEPKADIALMNGGGIRADLPKGPLSYGALYTVMPFDNRFALVKQNGKATRQMFARNLASNGGILSVAGARVEAVCKEGKLDIEVYLRDRKGEEKKLADDAMITIVTNDFLATGGDSILREHKEAGGGDLPLIREALVARMKSKPPTFEPSAWLDPKAPRMRYPDKRPVICQ